MKITLFAAGSQGDIQPCVALGKALAQAGYAVRLAAPENFASFVAEHGLPFYPLRGDVQQIMAGDTAREFMQSGGANPLRSISAIRKLVAPVVMQMAEDLYAACQDTHALICLGVFSAFGHSISSALHLPLINLEPAPLLPTRAFAAPSWPLQRDLGGLHNFFSGLAMLQVVWLWYRPFVNDFRRRLGLPSLSAAGFYRSLRSTPMISAYSPSIIPHPPDWPPDLHVVGYFFLDGHLGYTPPPELQSFLDAGDPPVYIGFGSMAGRHPQRLAGLVSDALALSRQRGVLLTGWGGLGGASAPGNLFILESAPHSWLFPRMAALVHHGGAGTTAEGLRAGVPAVIVPFAFDQSFWGARLAALGLGPPPLPLKQLTASRLADAITFAVSHPATRQRAQACGAAIRLQDGLGNAVEVVRQVFGEPGSRGA